MACERLAFHLVFPDSEYSNYSAHITKLDELLKYLTEIDCLSCIKEVRAEYVKMGDLLVPSIEAGILNQIRYEEYRRILDYIDKYAEETKQAKPSLKETQKKSTLFVISLYQSKYYQKM